MAGVKDEIRSEDDPVDLPRADLTELDGVVRSIGDHARTVNRSRAAGLSTALDRAATGQLSEAGRGAAAELAHQLVGSAGTFGFSGVSHLASELEQFFLEAEFAAGRVALARDQLIALLEQLAAEPTY